MVAGAFAVTFFGFGSAYAFAAFAPALQVEFAASRGAVPLVFSLAGFLYFGLGAISGPLADRVGSRSLAAVGMRLVGCGRHHRHPLHQRGVRHARRPVAAGLAFDLQGSYALPILGCACTNLLAAGILLVTSRAARVVETRS